jgi:protein associated with RNAse G/E
MFTVIKLNSLGHEIIRYPATVQTRTANGIILNAIWQHKTRNLGYATFETGDNFVEYFYADRWYNIFAIATPTSQRKGWYCNIAMPASISDDHLSQIDLLLDVWINPLGGSLILDQDEFAADLTLSEAQRAGAQKGLHDLLSLLADRAGPFEEIV